jgi:hypothetical protein
MAERVVDVLEAVEVKYAQCKRHRLVFGSG